MSTGELDDADVQGLVRFGYKRMTEAAYALLRVKHVPTARAWLRSAPVTSAVAVEPPPSTAMHVAFTAAGLHALGTASAVTAGFSPEFLGGMPDASRARRLGDVGANSPETWDWGYAATVPHVIVMFFAEPGQLDALVQRATGEAWRDAFDTPRWLGTNDIGPIEPFGFADGISQPVVDWEQAGDPVAARVDYRNVSALGEFLLGYRNEYGKYTDRPLLDASAGDAATTALPAAEDEPGKRDLGRNGTYLVVRQLRQDVRAFWQFVHGQAGADWKAADLLAAAMVGRTRAGDPLVRLQAQAIPGAGRNAEQILQNQFTFDDDPDGLSCPYGAHLRRANPRNTDYPAHETGIARLLAALGFGRKGFRDDLMSSVRFHRILRRGREYGPALPPAEALAPAPAGDPERGLHFACLNANISRQFEFLQNAWMMNTKFSALSGESDPLIGNRSALPGCPVTSDFIMQGDGGVRRRVEGLPQFVTVRGGAYFFLPGLRALRYIARDTP